MLVILVPQKDNYLLTPYNFHLSCKCSLFVENKVSTELSFKSLFVQRLHNRTRLHMEKEGDLVWVHLRKERFPHFRKSKLLLRGDDPFKIIKKINDDAYKVKMPREFGEDDAYSESHNQEDEVEEATPALEGFMTKGRLQKKPRGSASKGLSMLHDQEEAPERHISKNQVLSGSFTQSIVHINLHSSYDNRQRNTNTGPSFGDSIFHDDRYGRR
ncbi:hypothetical protein CR513_03037, partial [Mucuna pruriens]